MKRILYVLVAGVFACGFAGLATVAHAAAGDQYTKFDVQATVGADGVISVTQTMDLAFGSTGHGPQLWFLTRQAYDDQQDRLYTYGDFQVTSPTGAPANLDVTTESNNVQLRIGDANVTVSGTQTYVLTYTVAGGVNPDVTEPNAASNLDEIYWNVIGTDVTVPIANVSVTLTGPAAVSQTTCYTGTDFTTPCTSNTADGATATYTQSAIQPGEGFAVVGGWPVGTFPGAELKLVPHSQSPFSLAGTGGYVATGAGAVTVVSGFVLAWLRRRGRDEQYADVTPGEVPGAPDGAPIHRAEVTDAAVEFAPPAGIPPRLTGAIVREKTANEDVTATIIDLAVRGYVHLNQGQGEAFTLTRTNADYRSLNPVEQSVYSGLFHARPTITSQQMSDEDFYETYQGYKATIAREFDSQGWYRKNPRAVVAAYQMGGLIIAAGGGAGAVWLGSQLAKSGILGVGWLAVPFILLGLGMMIVARRMPVRTPVGSAVAGQAFGFKKYLETAEADQIKWEEG
ncbi:MAG: DUF2207 domain-containing protein, partial [Propionibacteriaceae bacterium]|nr:DUF2207 domain-containing protein [Propionibacteriaceae bacterium]